jgi:mannose-1-phosphate guanylyltransferase
LGSWDLVYEALEKDADQNVKMGDAALIETKKCLFSSQTKKIVAVGVEDLFVIETKDVIFVGKKGEAHRVKEWIGSNL